jgi:hypothetical protein
MSAQPNSHISTPRHCMRAPFIVSVVGTLALAFALLTAAKSLPQEKSQPKSAVPAAHASATKQKLASRAEYVGDTACAACHQDISTNYNKTAHHLTSQPANPDTVVGDFQPGANTMTTANANLTFRMDRKGDEFLQTAIWESPDAATEAAATQTAADSTKQTAQPPKSSSGARTRTERLDLVIGSGGKGQNYLFWRNDELFQLPVGYSTVLHHWINSPGYRDGTANFDRPIVPRCLECHAGYFDSTFPGTDSNLYDTKNFVLGITCERCHGPARKHVAAYHQNNAAKSAAATDSASQNAKSPQTSATTVASDNIVNPAKLPTARRADICAQCHGGAGVREILPEFSYVAGQPLEKYIDLGLIDQALDVDVHGKQGKLMMKSRCYQASRTMECSTCHDVHKKEPDLAAMSQRCLTCHKVEPSPTHEAIGASISKNCIDCHMPALESKVVNVNVDGKLHYPRFRTHWIKIYSESERQ